MNIHYPVIVRSRLPVRRFQLYTAFQKTEMTILHRPIYDSVISVPGTEMDVPN